MKREETLRRAIECVTGQRQQDYGSPEDNFTTIAKFWTIFLRPVLKPHESISPVQVALMMGLLKIGRLSTGTATEDSFIDLAGYAACAAELLEKEKITDLLEEPMDPYESSEVLTIKDIQRELLNNGENSKE